MPSLHLPPQAQLRSYRLLLGAMALGNVLFAVAHALDGATMHDPPALRAAVSAATLLLALATHVTVVQRYARRMLYGVGYGLIGYSTLLCVWNDFQPAYSVSYVGLVASLGLGSAVTSRRDGSMTAMMAASVVVPLVALILADVPDMGRVSFLLSLVATAAVAVLVAHVRTRDRAQITSERMRYRNIFESATDGLYLADLETRRILDANPAMQRLTGYSLGEMRALRIDDLIDVRPGEPAVTDNITEARLGDEIAVGPRRLRASDGRIVDIDVSATVMDAGDGTETMSIVVRDATERRATEHALSEAACEARAARHRAEDLLRLKASLLSNMSHEIRTPLTGILGYSELLGDEVSGEARDMVDAVQRGATRLMRTLNSVLDMARLDAEQVPAHTEPVDLTAEAHAAAEALQTVAAARGLALSVDAGASVWAAAEPGSVVRILDNLIGNAIKFTDAGRVTVRVGRRDGRAEISVADTGPGIPEAFRPHLFDEFRQASSGHARTHEGSGLGLALTRRLVERLGGAISVESADGAGSTFRVSFDCAEAPQALCTSGSCTTTLAVG